VRSTRAPRPGLAVAALPDHSGRVDDNSQAGAAAGTVPSPPAEVDGRASVGPVLVGWTVAAEPAVDVRLGPVDARRAAGFGDTRRTRFAAGRALLGRLLADRFGAGSVDGAPCPHCGGDHGGVAVRGVPAIASLAHAGSLAIAAVAADAEVARLGVDGESALADPARDADLARLLDVPAEAALRRWTEVEAVLKADGRGLRADPGLVRFAVGTALVEDTGDRYRLSAVPGPPDLVISVAWQPPVR